MAKSGKKIRSGQPVSKSDVDEKTWDYLLKNKQISEPIRTVEPEEEEEEEEEEVEPEPVEAESEAESVTHTHKHTHKGGGKK